MEDKIGAMTLPQAVIARILKEENVTASKESREAISRAGVVFLINVAGMACENAKEKNHKTVAADDVLKALKTFDNNTIYSQCKQAVDEWKMLKQQKTITRKNGDQTAAGSQDDSPSDVVAMDE